MAIKICYNYFTEVNMQEYKNIILITHCLLNKLSVNNNPEIKDNLSCLLYTSDAADEQ